MSLNKVMLIGNVGQDPDVRYVEKDMAVARVRLATTERGYTLANGTQVPDRTEWHSIVAWRATAQFMEKYVHKGDKIYVEGSLRSRTYDDKKGIQHTVVEVVCERVELCTARPAQRPE